MYSRTNTYKNVRESCATPAGRGPSSRSRPPGRMRIGAVESLSDYRLTSVRGRPCAIGYVGRPSVAGWRMAWRAWASHPVGWRMGKKKAGHHRWHPALSYRKA